MASEARVWRHVEAWMVENCGLIFFQPFSPSLDVPSRKERRATMQWRPNPIVVVLFVVINRVAVRI